jgi:hypothetical protein
MTCIKEEMKHLDLELDFLQSDKHKLEEIAENISSHEQQQQAEAALDSSSRQDLGNNNIIPSAWDLNVLLASKTATPAVISPSAATASAQGNDDSTANNNKTAITTEHRS